jgi:hypothetical protein
MLLRCLALRLELAYTFQGSKTLEDEFQFRHTLCAKDRVLVKAKIPAEMAISMA